MVDSPARTPIAPLHQHDHRRRADGEAPRRFADRAAALDRTRDPQPQVH
jgi:hypothetical protein